MEVLDLLKGASELVYMAVKDMAGTDEAGGDFGIGAGGDVSRNIDIIAEKTVIDYVKENGFDCTILGEECGRVEIGKEPKGFLIMAAILPKVQHLLQKYSIPKYCTTALQNTHAFGCHLEKHLFHLRPSMHHRLRDLELYLHLQKRVCSL